VRNNHPALNREPSVPYFVYRGNRLELDESYRAAQRLQGIGPVARAWRNAAAGLRNRSRVLQLADLGRVRLRALLERKVQAASDDSGREMADIEKRAVFSGEAGLDEAVYSPPTDPVWQEAWRVTEGLIVRMRDEVRALGAEFWIAGISTGVQVHPDPAVRETYRTEDLFYPDRRIQALADREGIPAILLARPLGEHARTHNVLLHGFPNAIPGFGHWNEEGHRKAGEIIASRLCEAWKNRKPGQSPHFPFTLSDGQVW
jgi:hypothetical protein